MPCVNALRDSAWSEPRSLKALESHLHRKGACAEAIEAARESWGEFSQAVSEALQPAGAAGAGDIH